jgi:CheY-like chemotaxis protein
MASPEGERAMPIDAKHAKYIEYRIQQLKVLLVDDSQFMRRIVRGLLGTIGIKKILEARDGIEALEIIRTENPDVVLLDWEMPLLNGPELVRIVRSPGVFPTPDLPIIVLTAHADTGRIAAAVKLGVNEFLCKPVSAKALHDRLTSIVVKPRDSVKLGRYYGPAPRPPKPGIVGKAPSIA